MSSPNLQQSSRCLPCLQPVIFLVSPSLREGLRLQTFSWFQPEKEKYNLPSFCSPPLRPNSQAIFRPNLQGYITNIACMLQSLQCIHNNGMTRYSVSCVNGPKRKRLDARKLFHLSANYLLRLVFFLEPFDHWTPAVNDAINDHVHFRLLQVRFSSQTWWNTKSDHLSNDNPGYMDFGKYWVNKIRGFLLQQRSSRRSSIFGPTQNPSTHFNLWIPNLRISSRDTRTV